MKSRRRHLRSIPLLTTVPNKHPKPFRSCTRCDDCADCQRKPGVGVPGPIILRPDAGLGTSRQGLISHIEVAPVDRGRRANFRDIISALDNYLPGFKMNPPDCSGEQRQMGDCRVPSVDDMQPHPSQPESRREPSCWVDVSLGGPPNNDWPEIDGVPINDLASFSDWDAAEQCTNPIGLNQDLAQRPLGVGRFQFDTVWNPSHLRPCDDQVADFERPAPVLGTLNEGERFESNVVDGRTTYSAPMSQNHSAVMLERDGMQWQQHSAAQASFIGVPVADILRQVALRYGCNPLSLIPRREFGGVRGAVTNYREMLARGLLPTYGKNYPWHLTAISGQARSGDFGVNGPGGLTRRFASNRICPVMALERSATGLGYTFEFEGHRDTGIGLGVDRLDVTFKVAITPRDGAPRAVPQWPGQPQSQNIDGVFAGIASLDYNQAGKNHPLSRAYGRNVVGMVGAGAPGNIFADQVGGLSPPPLQRDGRFNFMTAGMLSAPPPYRAGSDELLAHAPPVSASNPTGDRPVFLNWYSPEKWWGNGRLRAGSNEPFVQTLSPLNGSAPACNALRFTISIFAPLAVIPARDSTDSALETELPFDIPNWEFDGHQDLSTNGRSTLRSPAFSARQRYFAIISVQYYNRRGQLESLYFRNHFTNLYSMDRESNGAGTRVDDLQRDTRSSVSAQNVFDMRIEPEKMAVVIGRFSDVVNPTRNLSINVSDMQARFFPRWGNRSSNLARALIFPEPFAQTRQV